MRIGVIRDRVPASPEVWGKYACHFTAIGIPFETLQ
jgi:hypothetical protein